MPAKKRSKSSKKCVPKAKSWTGPKTKKKRPAKTARMKKY